MSKFINKMFSGQNQIKKYIEEVPKIIPLDMSNSMEELCNTPKQLINFTFKALWQMQACGTAKEYNNIHKLAIQTLTRNVYEEFYTKLTYLELALYAYDIEKAKEIIQDIKREVGI